MRWVEAAVAAAISLVMAVVGVFVPLEGDPDDPWGSKAERWLEAAQAAGAEGVPNLEAFLAPGAVLDHRGAGGPLAVGRAACLGLLRGIAAWHPETRLRPPVYLSPSGMVVPSSWDAVAATEVHQAVLVMRMSTKGLVRAETASALRSGRMLVDPMRDWGELEQLAARHVAVAEPAGTRLQRLPASGGPAVFGILRHDRFSGFRRAVLLLRSPGGSEGCPGRVAVVLDLDESGAVVAQERYERVDDVRRCRGEAQRFHGWWTRMEVPAPVQHVRTGTVWAGDVDVEIWNGTLALHGLVRWALGRFRLAGLPVPHPSSVTFYPAADRCAGNIALARGHGHTDIVLCFGVQRACPARPCPPWSASTRAVVLHELAHTWMSEHQSPGRRDAYAERVGLAWSRPDDPWERQAVERAAEVIAYGLQPAGQPAYDVSLPADVRMAEEFRLLTGVPPLRGE